MAVLIPRPQRCQSKTAPMCWLPAHPFLNPRITLPRFGRCAANNQTREGLTRSPPRDTKTSPSSSLPLRTLCDALSRHHRFSLFRRLGHDFVGLSHPDHFFNCCSPLGNTTPAVVPQ